MENWLLVLKLSSKLEKNSDHDNFDEEMRLVFVKNKDCRLENLNKIPFSTQEKLKSQDSYFLGMMINTMKKTSSGLAKKIFNTPLNLTGNIIQLG